MRSNHRNTNLADYPVHFFKGYERMVQLPVNIREDENTYIIELLAPGRNKEDFKISLDQEKLIISNETDYNKKEYSRQEFKLQPFKRVFAMPQSADKDNITAQYNNGILVVTIQKLKPQNTTRNVTIS